MKSEKIRSQESGVRSQKRITGARREIRAWLVFILFVLLVVAALASGQQRVAVASNEHGIHEQVDCVKCARRYNSFVTAVLD